ncbi:hypothetical protein SLE2022_230560 [Rubroshorea leprosula]
MEALASSQKLPRSSASSSRPKFTFSQAVLEKKDEFFPPALGTDGKAELTMLNFQGPNVAEFAVIASLQKQRQNGERVVLLESGWKPVVGKLGLREGDTVKISLLNKMPWTYSIEVERDPEADRIEEVDAMDEDVVPEKAPMKFDLNEPAQPDMDEPGGMKFDFDLNEPAADQIEEVDAMDENVVPEKAPMKFELNEPAQPDMDEPGGMKFDFDLNEPAADQNEEVDAMDEDVVPEKAPTKFDLNEPAQLDMDERGGMMFDFDLNEPAHPDMEINRNDKD